MLYAVVTVIVVARALLYADVLLNLYYVLMNAYGWYYWLYGGQQLREEAGELLLQRITVNTVAALVLITAFGTVLMGYGFAKYTQADMAYADSLTTVASFVAMWMSARKYLSSWVAWFLIDIVQIALYVLKGFKQRSGAILLCSAIHRVLGDGGLGLVKLAAQVGSVILVLTGPESSGKTTLARVLSEHLQWPVLPELARDYLTQRAIDTEQHPYRYRPSDLVALVQAQQSQEAQVRKAGHCIFDTDLLTLTLWWQEKYGPVPALFNEAWLSQSPRFYLLCRPDLPWEMDPLRENPKDRERLFEVHERQLQRRGCQYEVCDGTGNARAENALAIIKHIVQP